MAKFQHLIVLFFFFTLAISTVAQASTLEKNVIEVRGQGTVTVPPDHFSLTVAIVQIGRNTSKIRSLVDHKSNQVINIAENLNISPANISSARVNLRVIEEPPAIHIQGVEVNRNLSQSTLPQSSSQSSSQNSPQSNSSKVYLGVDLAQKSQNKTQKFELSRTITVNFSTIEDYDKFLSQVIKVGVEHIYPLTMSVANSDKSYQQALAKAIDNAKIKAYQIAKQANISLGKLVYLKELSSNHYQARLASANRYSDSAVAHRSQVADTAISASVLVKFTIKD